MCTTTQNIPPPSATKSTNNSVDQVVMPCQQAGIVITLLDGRGEPAVGWKYKLEDVNDDTKRVFNVNGSAKISKAIYPELGTESKVTFYEGEKLADPETSRNPVKWLNVTLLDGRGERISECDCELIGAGSLISFKITNGQGFVALHKEQVPGKLQFALPQQEIAPNIDIE